MELNPDGALNAQSVSALWAIDPREVGVRPSEGALAEIKHFLGDTFTQVHPIYVCADEKESLEEARVKMLEFLYSLRLDQTWPPEVCRSASAKRADWAESLLDLAHQQKDKIILVTSHGRSALGTIFLGSFASELLQISDIPVLFFSAQKIQVGNRHKVLFATDLSENSRIAFCEFLDFVQGKTSEVILCHILKLPMEPDYFLEYQKEWARVELEKFLSGTLKENVHPRVLNVIEESQEPVAQAIGKVAKREGVKLVGVATQGKPFEKFWSESVAQSLLPLQSFNLWVYGPHCSSSRKDE